MGGCGCQAVSEASTGASAMPAAARALMAAPIHDGVVISTKRTIGFFLDLSDLHFLHQAHNKSSSSMQQYAAPLSMIGVALPCARLMPYGLVLLG